MDDLAALSLQIEWGADEALLDHPADRRASRPLPAPPPLAMPALVRAPAPQTAETLAGAAADLDALRAAMAGFEGCALRHTATNLIFGQGDPAAGVTLIADVPGASEDRAGTPFAGPGGAFLDQMLASIGLDRTSVYSCSMLPWRPPGDRKPSEAEIQACLPFLWRHLCLLRPTRIVVLGALAVRTMLPAGARRSRGTWHKLLIPGLAAPVPTLALGSPMAIQAAPSAKRDAWADLIRLRRALDQDGSVPSR